MTYENNHKIVFTARPITTGATQVFKAPYGQNVRFRLLALNVYNENVGAQSLKVFDSIVTGAPADPPAQGDATTPLLTLGVSLTDHEYLSEGQVAPIIFQQGMTVVASGAAMVITATVEEA